jgi:hypothetical protein
MAKGFRFRNKSATKDLDDPLARVKVNKMRLITSLSGFGATHLVGELPRSNGQTTAWPSRA